MDKPLVGTVHRSLHESETLFRFLDELGRATVGCADADEVLTITTEMTAAHLHLSNCAYADMDADENGFTIRGNWHAPGSRSIVGHYHLADFGKLAVRELGAGRPLIINDNLVEIAPEEAKTFQDIGIAATICMPLVKAGRLVALMAVHDRSPRRWSDYDLTVIREVTEWSWIHVERVRADAQLRVSHARFEAAIRATRGVVWTNDAEGRMSSEQPGWSALTGQSREQYQGFGWTDAVHPDDVQPTIAAWNAAVAAQRMFVFEHRIRQADGDWGLFSIHAVPVLNDRGDVAEWVGVHTDVTPERAVEQALRDGNEVLEILNRTGTAIAAELDLEPLVQTVTDAGVKLTGAQFGAFFYNILDDRGESLMLYTLSGADRSAFERFPHPRATAIFAPTFSGTRVVRSADITAEPTFGLSSPFHGMPEGHLPVRSYLAVPVTSRTGEPIGGLFFGHEDRDVFSDRSERTMLGLAAQASVAIDNARLFQAVQRANHTLEDRVRQRSVELEQAHEALRQSQKMEAIGQLTGGIAHDFNNLLTVIRGSADLLRRPDLTEEKRGRYVAAISDTADRAAKLTGQLLAFARRQALKPEVFDAALCVHGISDMLRTVLGSRIRLLIDDDCRDCYVEADVGQFETSLVNLAVNARDAMDGVGDLKIAVRLSKDAQGRDMVAVEVSDTGHGIAREQLGKIFEPFFTTKEVGKGTGLGLSQVYGFTKQSEGEIAVESDVGVGTVFTLSLPKADVDHVPELVRGETAELTPLSGLVLVVEDNANVGQFASETLQVLGFRTSLAANAQEAIEQLAARPTDFDMVFSDVIMPGMSGIELGRLVRERWSHLPVVLTSGYSQVLAEETDHGFPLLHKPYSVEALSKILRSARRVPSASRGIGH